MQFCSLRLKSSFLAAAALALAAASLAQTGAIPATAIPITVDAHAPAHDFPHFWEKMFGSGHASLAMREGYRDDLKAVHDQVGMRYVRFHAILLDDVGVYNEDENGNAVYNFTYVDQIYDGLLARGVRPMVEISFMPYALASKNSIQGFWYKPNVSPPKDYGKWDALIRAFAQHLIDRPRNVSFGVFPFRVIAAALHYARQVQTGRCLNHCGMKDPSRQSKTNHAHTNRFAHNTSLTKENYTLCDKMGCQGRNGP